LSAGKWQDPARHKVRLRCGSNAHASRGVFCREQHLLALTIRCGWLAGMFQEFGGGSHEPLDLPGHAWAALNFVRPEAQAGWHKQFAHGQGMAMEENRNLFYPSEESILRRSKRHLCGFASPVPCTRRGHLYELPRRNTGLPCAKSMGTGARSGDATSRLAGLFKLTA
jgi:hypothetical protein